MPYTKGVKRRDLPWEGWTGSLKTLRKESPDYVGFSKGTFSGYMGIQITESENHPEWKRKDKTPLYRGDVGGNFLMRKQYVATPIQATLRNLSATFVDKLHTGYTVTATYIGGSIPTGIPPNPFAAFEPSSDAELEAWGTKAIAICKPTLNQTSLAVTMAELFREGLPHLVGSVLWKDRTSRARGAGGEYLNVEFGFKPLANDIAKFAYGVVYFDRLRAQYERDSGKVVRRRFEFPPIETVVYRTVASAFVRPAHHPSSTATDTVTTGSDTGAQTALETHTVIRRWFEGAFTYYAPPRGAFGGLSQARKILGLELTPENIWAVTPWSWAVDWFTNAGSVLKNYQAFAVDGLVMRRGYMMEHKTITNTYYHVGPILNCWGDHDAPAPMSFVTETKKRIRATPYGFGLTMSGLTGRQQAVIAALGISRL